MSNPTPRMPRIPELPESPYSRSALRLLGLTGSDTSEAMASRVRELLAEPGGSPDPDVPWLPPAVQDPERIQAAWELLQKPEERLRERLFWFHIRTLEDQQALEALAAGRAEEAQDLWLLAWKAKPNGSTLAAHNLAVLYHSRAVSAPRGSQGSVRDMDQARRWWRFVSEAGRMAEVLHDGEEAYVRESTMARRVERQFLPFLKDILGADPTAQKPGVPFLRSENKPQGDATADNPRLRRGRMLATLEEGYEAARRGDREGVERALDVAKGYVIGGTDGKFVEDAEQRLLVRLVTRDVRPLRSEPVLVHGAGLGTTMVGMSRLDVPTRSYETRVMFTIGHIPVLTLGRYRVRMLKDETVEFLGRLPTDGWMLVHGLVSIGFLVILLWGVVHFSQISGYRLAHLRPAGSTVVTGPAALSPQELRDLEESRATRLQKIRELDGWLPERREEQTKLRTQLALLARKRQWAGSVGDPEKRKQALEAVNEETNLVRNRLKYLGEEIELGQEILRELRELEKHE